MGVLVVEDVGLEADAAVEVWAGAELGGRADGDGEGRVTEDCGVGLLRGGGTTPVAWPEGGLEAEGADTQPAEHNNIAIITKIAGINIFL
jgi:hypothetical protein